MTRPFDLTGRNVLITGASSGLGRRFALQAAASGARVAVAARRLDLLETLVDEIRDLGGEAVPVAMDVQDEASIVSAFDRAQAALGVLNSVVANAGVSHEGPTLTMTAADFDTVMAVNVRGVFLTAREAAARMIKAGAQDGRIVLMASIGGQTLLPGLTTYCASKAAVMMMGRGLAREWANKGVGVNVVCPGYIETEMTADWFASDGGKRHIASLPRRRLMEEGGLDAMMLYLVSDEARAITGSVFTLDDGQSL